MIMTSVLGHVKMIDFPKEYSDWQRTPIESLFDANIISEVSANMREVANNLQIEAKKSNVLIIWTDCDREGEYIGSEIVQICTSVNIKLDVYRARYSVLNYSELFRSLQSISRINQNLVDAASLRSELDLRSGAAFTRLQTLYFRPRHSQLADKVVSYGPCQFPTLGFVVERYLKIKEFQPKDFWYLALEISGARGNDSKIVTKFNWDRNRVYDHLSALVLYSAAMEQSTLLNGKLSLVIKSVHCKPASKWRPLPLRTVELQKFCSRWLKLSSDKVMKIAESLYNKGFISYPRTETDQFEKDFDFKALILKQQDNWGFYGKSLLEQGKFRCPRKGKNNDNAHPPIHPTKSLNKDLSGSELQVFEFISRRFLASCSDDAKGYETVMYAQMGAESFTAKGLMMTEANYLDVYKYEKWSEKTLGRYEAGDLVTDIKLFEISKSCTSPPKLLSESDLIGTMDKNGIGTDATIHEHIKKIIDRSYVIKNKEALFHPTNFGLSLVKGYDQIGLEESLTRPKLRSILESDLAAISQGIKLKSEVSREAIFNFKKSFGQIRECIEVLHKSIQENSNLSLFDPAPLSSTEKNKQLPKNTENRNQKRKQQSSNNTDNHEDFKILKSPLYLGKSNISVCMPSCNCQGPVELKCTKKPGPNKGREFWSCSNCNFFEWKTNDNQENEMQQENIQFCFCQKEAIQRTVVKEGSNKGKKFFCCNQDKRCSYFNWTESASENSIFNTNGSERENLSRFNESIKCECDLSVQRIKANQGDNAGRFFLKCSKLVNKCSFFEWEDGKVSKSEFQKKSSVPKKRKSKPKNKY